MHTYATYKCKNLCLFFTILSMYYAVNSSNTKLIIQMVDGIRIGYAILAHARPLYTYKCTYICPFVRSRTHTHMRRICVRIYNYICIHMCYCCYNLPAYVVQ